MTKTRIRLRRLLMSRVRARRRGRAVTLPKYRSKSVKQKRFRPPAMASKTALTLSKCAWSAMTPLLSTPGRRKSSTTWFCCTAAMSSSFETDPLLSVSMSSKISRNSSFVLLAACAASARPWKCAAKSRRSIRCLPLAIFSNSASAASKLRSSLMREPQSTPGSISAATSLSLARAVMSSSFEMSPLKSVSMDSKTSRTWSGISSSCSPPPIPSRSCI
mmetsp:Transcript_39186/g.109005  ORF Transcript_39186/g.109005 Transcript_39186/m.109005 type:complete len:218 (-) Transcript_39186:184-837(-)